jgi:membrane-associated phospholipid phosphatase
LNSICRHIGKIIVPVLFLPVFSFPQLQDNFREEIKNAVDRGIQFLDRSTWDFDFVFVYSFLRDRFEWPVIEPQKHTEIIFDSLQADGGTDAVYYLDQYQIFRRMIDPSFVPDFSLFAKVEELDSVVGRALYCDVFPVDSAACFQFFEFAISNAGYPATHALLAYNWLRSKGCIRETNLSPVAGEIIRINQGIIHNLDYWSDLRIEAATLLKDAGFNSSPDWTRAILHLQQPDGGWLHDFGRSRSDTHTTILAIWYLAMQLEE